MKICNNTIYNMDCLEGMKYIPDKSVDMILCDLPYGTTACKWDSIIPFELLWSEYERIIKDNGAIVLTASQPFTSKLVASNFKLFRYEWIWKKGNHTTGFQNANRMPLKNHENVCIFYKKLPTYNPQGVQHIKPVLIKNSPKMKVLGDRNETLNKPHVVKKKNFPKSVVDFPRDNGTFHPTQKPIALFEYLVKTYTNEGDTVLDNCMGGFTTAVACDNTGRNWIGFELESEYCEKGKDRINKNRQTLDLVQVEILKATSLMRCESNRNG
ncbi:DNA-methyltransferase [Lysinibacillus sphaericus]|uniref:DNA-methyltransferase n=1 Tax=Lysinibacillus sphaericus TaxID=1421 RepID=UPI0018CE0A22|nr:DNA methyltransferase [Lysinibacillus sphaericus]MBG9479373.1 cytosine methyltransferase [Lysinibacillus sphaericus]MBG9479422.1 cytosine methyltransferase [Lysinibacillus sphaericus]